MELVVRRSAGVSGVDIAYIVENHERYLEVLLMAAKKGSGDELMGVIKSINGSPMFGKIASAIDAERVGLQLHRNGRVEGEYTNRLSNGRLVSVNPGIRDVEFIIRIDLDMWDQVSTPEETKWMQAHPLDAVKKYWRHIEMPFMVKMRIGAKLLMG